MRKMSGVAVLKSLGGRFRFREGISMGGERRYGEVAFRIKNIVVLEVLGLKTKFKKYVKEYRKWETSKHQDVKQSSFNLGFTNATIFNSYWARSLTPP